LESAQAEIEEVRASMNAEFTEQLGDRERFDEGRFWKRRRAFEKKWRDPTTSISTSSAARKNARSRDCRLASVLSLIPQSPKKNTAGKPSKSGRKGAPGSARSNDVGRTIMTKKPKVVWVGSTPITPITPKQRKNLHKLMEKRLEMRRKKYPEVRGKVVDYISHSIDDGTLCMNQNGEQAAAAPVYSPRSTPGVVKNTGPRRRNLTGARLSRNNGMQGFRFRAWRMSSND
jgi:hypothetical protein